MWVCILFSLSHSSYTIICIVGFSFLLSKVEMSFLFYFFSVILQVNKLELQRWNVASVLQRSYLNEWKKIVKSSHYYLYSTFNNAICLKAALHQLYIKLGGFTSALQYLDGEIVCRNNVILLWPDKISSLNLGCSRVRLCKGLIWFLWSCPDGRLHSNRALAWPHI